MHKSVYIKTFGCQMNERDSEIMSQLLSSYGYIEGMEIESADLVILNTCSIRAKAEQKVMSLLGSLRKIKAERPEMKICVAGCVAQQEGEQLLRRMPHIDLVVGTQHVYDIGKLLENSKISDRAVVKTGMSDKFSIPAFLPAGRSNTTTDVPVSSFRRFVTIMQGCNNYCSYCIVPYTRGREISRNINDIIDEVKVLVGTGVKEITLLGQNVNSYGRTNMVNEAGPRLSFPDLLHRVAKIPGLARLRFTTSHPKDLSDELIKCFRDIDKLCPQFHLPVQSGSDAVLKRMNRKYTIADYLKKVEKLVICRPDLALTTDIIVGFPGETDEDFQQTMDLLENVRYHGSFSFKYSDRPGTRSSDFTDKVGEQVKSERLARFQKRQDEISLERNRAYLQSVQKILIENVGPDSFQGRTGTNHIVHVAEATNLSPGGLQDVLIIHAGQHSLQGKTIKLL
jgi:tRNA-2-methylthio-N6-dimethylallyladenosine synthase